LNLVYLLLVVAVSPVLLGRAVTRGKYRQGWSEKLWGRLPRTEGGRKVVWVHAVSVGEVLQLKSLVPRLQSARPDCEVLITTTTTTGRAVAGRTFPDCRVSYFPLDFTWAVRAALARVRPVLVVLVELELWPNFIRATDAAGVPLALINGRMSRRSFRGYRRARFGTRPLLERFARIAVQTGEYAQRFVALGAPPEKLIVTGSVKYDGVACDRHNAQSVALREAFGIADSERVFIAGSTHEPEERIALDAYWTLHEEFPDLRLVLVPRHAERFDEVARLVTSRGARLIRRSQQGRAGDKFTRGTHGLLPVGFDDNGQLLHHGQQFHHRPVCLLDTLGELSACWGLANVAFVGGSLTARGGQNMIEPAAFGAAVIVGPNTHNFRDVVEGLQSRDAICVIDRPDALASAVRELLRDPQRAERQGAAARAFVREQQGATDLTLQLLVELLPPPSNHRVTRAA
jgi:3-deoxy-D-manno-octulosonic-acid transferase